MNTDVVKIWHFKGSRSPTGMCIHTLQMRLPMHLPPQLSLGLFPFPGLLTLSSLSEWYQKASAVTSKWGSELGAFTFAGPESTCWPHDNHCSRVSLLARSLAVYRKPTAASFVFFLHRSDITPPPSTKFSKLSSRQFPEESFSRTRLLFFFF